MLSFYKYIISLKKQLFTDFDGAMIKNISKLKYQNVLKLSFLDPVVIIKQSERDFDKEFYLDFDKEF